MTEIVIFIIGNKICYNEMIKYIHKFGCKL